MQYETTGKKVTKNTIKGEREYSLKSYTTTEMLWHLVKRHKFTLVCVYAIAVTALYLIPFLPDVILSAI